MSLRIQSRFRWSALLLSMALPALILAGCGSVPTSSDSSARGASSKSASRLPKLPRAGSGRGGYYQDDGPGDAPPEGLLDTPDAEPKIEPYSTRANKPYVVFGVTYTPFTDDRPFRQRGIGSWYGRKFHGQKTSTGEPYNMYGMTAAHPTLPIPSYARVTNLVNGKQVIVRVNDRGPFHSDRIIDLSYTAALKLGYLASGSSQLEVQRILPDEIQGMASARKQAPSQPAPAMMPEYLSDASPVPSAPEPEARAIAAAAPDQAMGAMPARPMLVSYSPATPSVSPAAGYYLQLGAFTQMENAEAARQRLAQSLPVSLPAVEMVEFGLFYRLYSGPFASRDEAAAAAAQLQQGGAAKPLIVQR
ncbi:MAG TPA: septal ring lytic transglycosylase RlpA family protein [Noviherbaspirillum sp.]|uniref:septal ring lytic transglycosylase RlpA family protein n=1 Tax=Noviherbaspirillum sp. TaxID=1926288 RepID=UPI002B48385A|nr:septal ring lytic transglycosylase RlpA family protein [Noviherbaspirillum sp.]HJV87167.1 septal ring lytic transglycosylase RlpA family protein [Noviherbaspirillum sp.]